MSKHFRIDLALEVGALAPLEARRFATVLRLGVGDELRLCDARGRVFLARVASLEPHGAEMMAEVIAEVSGLDADPAAALTVWVPLLKGGKTDDLVRQVTELGATRIVTYSSRHSVARLDAKKARERQVRFAEIAAQACNQCGRTTLPEVLVPVDHLPRSGPGIFLWEGGGTPIMDALANLDARLTLLVGPEGGLARDEADALVALGWIPATLGTRILRAETAVLALVTLASYGPR